MKPLPFPRHIPFVEELDFQLWAFGDGKAELRLDIAERHTNSYSVAHGGVLMTLLDVAMAHAARSTHGDDGPGVVTIEMKTSFLRAAEGQLAAHGTLLHRTTTMAFTEGRIVDAAGQLCAHATATFKFIRALPTAARSLKPFNPAKESP